MTHPFGTIVLAVATAFCVLTAWQSGTEPHAFAERLGLAVANAGGNNEIRAQYAGFFLAVALLCAAALAGLAPRQAALIVLAVVFGGLLFGRVVSLAVDGGVAGYGPLIRALYAIDAVGLALSVAALVSEKTA